MTSNPLKNHTEIPDLPSIKKTLHLLFYFWSISDSYGKKVLFQPLIHKPKPPYTTNPQSHHITVPAEFKGQRNRMFHSKFSSFINHKTWPIQNQPVCKHPFIADIITWIMMIFYGLISL